MSVNKNEGNRGDSVIGSFGFKASQETVMEQARTNIDSRVLRNLEWAQMPDAQKTILKLQDIILEDPFRVPIFSLIGPSFIGKSVKEANIALAFNRDKKFREKLTEASGDKLLGPERQLLDLHISLGNSQTTVAEQYGLTKDEFMQQYPDKLGEAEALQFVAIQATRNAFSDHPIYTTVIFHEAVVVTKSGARGRRVFNFFAKDPYHHVLIPEGSAAIENRGLAVRTLALENKDDPTIDAKLKEKGALGTKIAGNVQSFVDSSGQDIHRRKQWADIQDQWREDPRNYVPASLDDFLSEQYQDTRWQRFNDWMKGEGLTALGLPDWKKPTYLPANFVHNGVHLHEDLLTTEINGNSNQFPYHILYDDFGRLRSPLDITAEEILYAMGEITRV